MKTDNTSASPPAARLPIMVSMYLGMLWPIQPLAGAFTSVITGVPYAQCVSSIGRRYFLGVFIVCFLTFQIGHRSSFRGLQICVFLCLACWFSHMGLSPEEAWHHLPAPLQSWLEAPWIGFGPCTFYVALFLFVGFYGRFFIPSMARRWTALTSCSRACTSGTSLALLLALWFFQSANVHPVFVKVRDLCEGVQNGPTQDEIWMIIVHGLVVRGLFAKIVDIAYAGVICLLIAMAISPFTPWLSRVG